MMKKMSVLLSCVLLMSVSLPLWSVSDPTSKGRIQLDVDITDDAGVDTVSKVVTLKNIKASEIEPFIRARLSRYGTVQVNDALNMVIITDKKPKIDDLNELVITLDQKGAKEFLRLETESISLKYVQANDVVTLIGPRLSDEGQVLVDVQHNAIVVTDKRSKIEFIKQLIPLLDTPIAEIATERIPLKYSNAQDIEPMVRKWLSSNGVISIDNNQNALVVTDIRSKIDTIKSYVTTLDVPIPQLLIETKIVEIDGNYAQKVGIDWEKVGNITGKLSSGYSKQYDYDKTIAAWKEGAESGGMKFETAVSLSVVGDFINFLVNEGKAHVIAKPRVVTLTGQQASISNTIKVPYTYSGSSNEDMSQFGLSLNVTPNVRSKDLINLVVNARVSDLTGWSNKLQPITYSREFSNNVNVKNSETFLVSGIEKTSVVRTDKGIPILRSILPIIFSQIVKTEVKNQILVFITTTIIGSENAGTSADTEQLKSIEKK